MRADKPLTFSRNATGAELFRIFCGMSPSRQGNIAGLQRFHQGDVDGKLDRAKL
jgi:hypothetical protein